MRSDRAKIFAPFSPLRGLDEAYRQKERTVAPKAELICDRIDEIDRKLKSIRIGQCIEITYYGNDCYKKKRGRVTGIFSEKELIVVGVPIAFSDIYDIELL